MKEFMFKVVYICDNTCERKTMIKEYRANSAKEATRGITEYLMTNKTIRFVMDLRIFEELE